MIDFVNNMSGQSAQPNINFQEISSIDLLLPPIKEQRAISEVLSSLDDKIDLLHRQNKTFEALAQTLFRQWFIEEADDEWEEKPLDRFIAIAQAHATTMGHIKRKDLDNAMCFVLSDDEIKVMDEQMVPFMEKMENNSKQIKTLENMRDTLLSKLMSGEVRVRL